MDMNALARPTEGHMMHAEFAGPIVMLGFGSIGRGVLPLLERHIGFDRSKFVVIAPDDSDRRLLDERKLKFEKLAITRENYRDVLTPLLTGGPGRGMIVNLSVDTSSADLIDLCKDIDAFYIDTVCEPWPGLYTNAKATISERSNYALREGVLDVRRRRPGGVTAVSCCGANPGMVSWFVKQALIDIATELKLKFTEPTTREGWGKLMQQAGVKGIHIAERDTQRARDPKPFGKFINTWSVEGFCSEGLQPSELGWGTHEKAMPTNGHRHTFGCDAAIYLTQPGAGTRVRSWTPTAQSQHGFLVTHNEAISITDYFTLREGDKAVYRPTCHYAYHPCDDAVLSLHEMAGNAWKPQATWHILTETDIVDGVDELGVLLYGHAKNAYWYGSSLSIEETRKLAPYQNATGLQVTSAVLAGIVWMLENPDRGLIEADEMDFRRCLEIQLPYLGPVFGKYTDWTPLKDRPGLFPEDLDTSDPWQFKNVLVG
jgi:homospermidine synthase